MRQFALIFRMDLTTREAQPSKAEMDVYMQQWVEWIHEISSKGQLSEGGNHFSRRGTVLKGKNDISDGPFMDGNTSVAGYIIILAENLGGAIDIARKCPILNGENTSVEIREIASPGE